MEVDTSKFRGNHGSHGLMRLLVSTFWGLFDRLQSTWQLLPSARPRAVPLQDGLCLFACYSSGYRLSIMRGVFKRATACWRCIRRTSASQSGSAAKAQPCLASPAWPGPGCFATSAATTRELSAAEQFSAHRTQGARTFRTSPSSPPITVETFPPI